MAKKMINFVNDDGSTVAIETDAPEPTGNVPPEPERLRKVPGKVHDADLKIITDAISLKRATVSYRTLSITDGAALTEICQDWLRAESARLSGKGGA